jgi:hypothetical protein
MSPPRYSMPCFLTADMFRFIAHLIAHFVGAFA